MPPAWWRSSSDGTPLRPVRPPSLPLRTLEAAGARSDRCGADGRCPGGPRPSDIEVTTNSSMVNFIGRGTTDDSMATVFTPDNEPYLGRLSLCNLDHMIVAFMDQQKRIAAWTHGATLSPVQKAASQIVPSASSIALSIRELVRQGYLLSALILTRPPNGAGRDRQLPPRQSVEGPALGAGLAAQDASSAQRANERDAPPSGRLTTWRGPPDRCRGLACHRPLHFSRCCQLFPGV